MNLFPMQRSAVLETGRISNPPIYHASSVFFDNHEQLTGDQALRIGYGREGNPTKYALKERLARLEGGHGTVLYPSGLSAIANTLLALAVERGSVLMAEGVYEPTIDFARSFLSSAGVEIEYFDSNDLARLRSMLQRGHRLVYFEPVSHRDLEVAELSAIGAECKKHQATSIVDATWCAGITANPLEHGIDVVIHSLTKFFSGGSDVFLGAAIATEEYYYKLAAFSELSGNYVSSQDTYLVLRGQKTAALRYAAQSRSCEAIAKSMRDWRDVHSLKYPKLDPNFRRACGYRPRYGGSLLAFKIERGRCRDFAAFFEALDLIRVGHSWGGVETILIYYPDDAEPDCRFRLHVGLEDQARIARELRRAIDKLTRNA